MAEFQRYAEDPGYRPLAPITRGDAAAAKAQKDIQQMQSFFNNNRTVDQQRIEDARFAGQNWKALAEFLPSAIKLYEQVETQTARDKAIGEQWAIDVAPSPQQQEAEALTAAQADVENATVKPIVSQLDPISASKLDNDARQIGRGFNGERGLLTKAKSTLPGYYTSYLNRTDVFVDTPMGQMPIVEAYNSTSSEAVQAALQAARWAFISENKLQYATKTNFVSILSDTIKSTEGYMLTNALNKNITQAAADQKSSYEGLAYAYGRAGFKNLAEAQEAFSSLSDQLYYAPNANLTRREANEAVVTSLATGLAMRGDYDGAASLKRVRVIAEQEGTELGYTFGKQIDEAIAIAKATAEKNITAEGQIIERNMRQRLDQLPETATFKERQAIIDESVKAAKAIGDYKTVDRINGDRPTLTLSNDVASNDSKLLSQIQSDILPDRGLLEQQYKSGKISKGAYDQATKAIEQKEALQSPQIKPVYKRWTDELQGQLDAKLGIKRDPLGFFQLPNKFAGLISQSQLTGYYAAYERDVNLVAQQSLARSEGMTPEQRSAQLDKDLDQWFKNQVMTEGGKYYNGGFMGDPEASNAKKAKRYQKFWKRWDDPAFRARPTSFPQQLSSLWDYGSPIPEDVKYAANTQRDYVIGYDDLMISKENWEAGLSDTNLQLAAADLGISPYTLLNDQLGVYEETKVKPKVSSDTLAKSESNPDAGIHAFEQVGFPTKGASYLAAAVAIANGWKDPKALDIDRWPEELEARDPVAFNRLMLPQSSDRHLQAAIESLFGPMPSLSIAAQSLYA